jgi:hypothetical protein
MSRWRTGCLQQHAAHRGRSAGRYDDALTRTPGGWRITAQTLTARWASGNREILQPDQGGTFLD